MKHENNFLLYGIASAFLITSGMMLLSSASYERSMNLSANIISVTAVVPEKETYKPYSISGSISGLDENSRQVVKVSLWRENGDGVMKQVNSSQLNSVTGFSYSFTNLRAGLYALKLETSDGVDIIEPQPFIQGISEGSHIMFIVTNPDTVQYIVPDFTVSESV
jgi:hypothetical protein